MKPCTRRPCRRRATALQALATIAANLPAYFEWHARYRRTLRRPVPPTRKSRPEIAGAGGRAAAAAMTREERIERGRAGGLAKARNKALRAQQAAAEPTPAGAELTPPFVPFDTTVRAR